MNFEPDFDDFSQIQNNKKNETPKLNNNFESVQKNITQENYNQLYNSNETKPLQTSSFENYNFFQQEQKKLNNFEPSFNEQNQQENFKVQENFQQNQPENNFYKFDDNINEQNNFQNKKVLPGFIKQTKTEEFPPINTSFGGLTLSEKDQQNPTQFNVEKQQTPNFLQEQVFQQPQEQKTQPSILPPPTFLQQDYQQENFNVEQPKNLTQKQELKNEFPQMPMQNQQNQLSDQNLQKLPRPDVIQTNSWFESEILSGIVPPNANVAPLFERRNLIQKAG
jgi:hypothetical protein